jgi:preprotein translocase subunit YajC
LKRQEYDARQAEKKAQELAEEQEIKPKNKKGEEKVSKVTRYQIEQKKKSYLENLLAQVEQMDIEKSNVVNTLEEPIPENINHKERDEAIKALEEGNEYVAASGLEAILNNIDDDEEGGEKHPEKRMKAAYKKYEEENLPELKEEFPKSKYSQLKQMLWKQVS